jgi:hypothetical protein
MKHIEAMGQALSILVRLNKFKSVSVQEATETIMLLRQAIAMAVQEPVAYRADTPESELPKERRGQTRGPFGAMPPPAPPRPESSQSTLIGETKALWGGPITLNFFNIGVEESGETSSTTSR